MHARIKKHSSVEPRLLSTSELAEYVGLGRNRTVEFGDAAGARVRVGRRVLWDRAKIDLYLSEIVGS